MERDNKGNELWEEEDEDDPTTITKVICHSEGFIISSGNKSGFINTYQISTEFEVRIVESYLCQSNGINPIDITSLHLSYDKNHLVFGAIFEDKINN